MRPMPPTPATQAPAAADPYHVGHATLRDLDALLTRARHGLAAAEELALALRDAGELDRATRARVATVCWLLEEAAAAVERMGDLLPVPPPAAAD
jgi:hypothetical protein